MAYASSFYSISYAETLAAGFPFVVGRNIAEEAISVRWCHGTAFDTSKPGSFWAPTEHAIDGRPWTATWAASNGTGATYSLFLKLSTGFAEFDVAGYVATEDLDVGSSPSFSVAIANDAGDNTPDTFTTIDTVSSLTSANTRITAMLDVSSVYYKYNAVNWVRFTWSDFDAAPSIGQVFLGLRVPLLSEPELPFDDYPVGIQTSPLSTYGGHSYNYVNDVGFSDFDVQLTLSDRADSKLGGTSQLTYAKQLWARSIYGAKPVIFWRRLSEVNRFRYCLLAGSPDLSLVDAYFARPVFSFSEIPPYEAIS